MTAEEKLAEITALMGRYEPGEDDPLDLRDALNGILNAAEDGEVGRVDVSAAMPGPMSVVFATGLEVGSVEHDDLGLLLELVFDTAGGGWTKVILPDESSSMLASAIVDGSTMGRELAKNDHIEKVTGKLWTPS